ncbi:MAG: type VI secretion system contractile sheath large subunit [Gemmatimonas sp.]|uniref:type VI secretion system contractile sheath large subunit n=1 Tax=Gemmatimonas sp. UBA7669 TaxID=1946568 RepID=UPI0025BB7F10|nr:type VI secretion system contractile sheath large subunit [Gemmatimonas sp. UBA7669]MBA3917784.1 type VI secretion system contractile sheath large subunit [Gemmatimonas sp.]
MADAQQQAAQAVTTDAELSLLDQIVEQGKMGKDAEAKSKGKDLVKRFVSEVLEGAITINRDTETMINARIAQIDHLLSLQLNEILHHPEFQKLEGSWRGLQYLMKQSETGTMLKIKVLNVSKKDLLRDLQRAPEFDQSALFKKIYEEEYGVFGGTPFGAMVGDYYFDKSGQDIELLEKISNVAAAAHAPFISAADPTMLSLESWSELDNPRDLAKIFDSTEYAKWKGFRNTEDSRYVALTAPRMLAREPYGSATVPIEAFNYEERVDGTNHDHYCWTNSAYAMAANVNKAFAMYGWCASIRGVESGGLVEQLPVHNFRTESGEIAMKCPTEVQITDRREKELADLGFAPLVHQKGTANAAFFSVQSAQKPKVYDDPAASSSSRMSAQLPYIFATSRFAHYLKVMMRDKIGGYTSKDQIHGFLNRWIQNYVAAAGSSPSVMQKKPLSDARIDVVEVAGKPGAYRAVAFLKPHYQLDELGVSMRLVADLPQPAK